MKIHFLGDIHGDFMFYKQWISQNDPNDISIVLGDFGLGFNHLHDKEYTMWADKDNSDKNFFIRGNHDNPEVCNKQHAHLGDFGLFKNKIFFVAGGWSIDREWRTPGKDFWINEELTTHQCEECLSLYEKIKPDIVISHDCPESIKDMLVPPIGVKPCKTGLLMDAMLNIHRPSIWIGAHYHVSKRFEYLGTKFIYLNIKETFTLDIPIEGEENAF